MATMAQIREGLAANLAPLKSQGWQVSAYVMANPTGPSVHVFPGGVRYDQAMRRGLDYVDFTVQAHVPMVSDKGSQIRLDVLMAPTGSGSMKTLIESDDTLGGVVDDLHVTEASGYQTVTLEGQGTRLLVEWTVQVLASN